MAELGCDFFMAGCHKWILGPRGTGLVWGRPEAWERIVPTVCPFHQQYLGAREYGLGPVPKPNAGIMTPGGFRAYEHRWALAEAFKYHLDLGKPDVERRIHELALQCRTGLAAMKHVTLHTPVDTALASGIICFEVAGMKPDAVTASLLAKGIIGSTTPYVPPYARLTPSVVNTPEEIDRALGAVRGLA
jgi:selenocysteine lyase/cysteine desulfurase